MSFEHALPTTNMNHITNPVTISHSEYAATWFLIGILVTAVIGLVGYIRKNK
jgi:cytochrome oxidase assembly protein ShyY1